MNYQFADNLIRNLRVVAIGAGIAVMLFVAQNAYCTVFDFEVRSPSWEMLEKAANEKANKESYDRVNDPSTHGEPSSRDFERAGTWEQGHMAWDYLLFLHYS